ncbi:RIP metalloprotease RseP [bacterium]|nr:RIP metalloprotease RseP [bacterium]
MYKYLFGIVLLGIVVIVHEFGHFIFARIFGVRVEVFSIGFGKPLFKKKSGDTEYRISMIPLGGYVKMLGESTSEENEVEEKDLPFAFSSKKWWQKVIIVSAGPVFNLIFAFIVFIVVSFFMFEAASPVVDFAYPDGAAYAAGISDGDRILKINGEEIAVWDDIPELLFSLSESGKCEEVAVEVEKAFTKEVETYVVHPKTGSYTDLFGDRRTRCELGIVGSPREPRIVLRKNFPGLENGDLVLSVDGEKILRYYELVERIKKPFKNMTVVRGEKEISVDFPEETETNDTESKSEKPEIAYGGLMIDSVKNGSYSEKIGIKKGDIITGVNGTELTSGYLFSSLMGKLKEGDSVKMSVIRDGNPQDVEFNVSFDEKEDEMTGIRAKRMEWGAKFYDPNIEEFRSRRKNLMTFPVRYAFKEMVEVVVSTFKGLAYMISGKISTKGLGGPIMIFDISKRAADAGLRYFLAIMAMISVNLGLVNLFPIPVLDGGYVVIYTIEGVIRRKIPAKIKEKALYVGLFLLLALMVFAIFNDFTRYIPMFLNRN